MKLRNKKIMIGYLFALPPFAFLMMWNLYPSIFSAYVSMTKWNILRAQKPFVGLENYLEILADPTFFSSLRVTLYFVVGSVLLGLLVSLAMAVIVNKKFPFRSAVRIIYFLPHITSMVAVAAIWNWLYSPSGGLINVVLSFLHLPTFKWVFDVRTVIPSLVIVHTWAGAGYGMILFLAGLQSIPKIYYEAAKIDGADSFNLFVRITLPLLAPTILFYVIIKLIGDFQTFDLVYVMTKGGPIDASKVVMLEIYDSAFGYLKFGRAAAMSFILFVIIFALTLLNIRLYGKGRSL